MSMLELKNTPSTLHSCPNCGKDSLAQIGTERFACIWCGFRRDISRSSGIGNKGDSGGVIAFFVVVAFIVVVLMG